MMRSQTVIREYLDKVRHIVDDVRERGDEAIIKYIEELDGVKLTLDKLEVPDEDFKRARK
ncbi:MAG: histidinol dehydrogenase, partial [Candidatus Bathyarchaeia archaeon]